MESLPPRYFELLLNLTVSDFISNARESFCLRKSVNLLSVIVLFFPQVFYTEVLESIRNGVANNVVPENIILEINASK